MMIGDREERGVDDAKAGVARMKRSAIRVVDTKDIPACRLRSYGLRLLKAKKAHQQTRFVEGQPIEAPHLRSAVAPFEHAAVVEEYRNDNDSQCNVTPQCNVNSLRQRIDFENSG
jgi:hypothetical protein